MLIPLASNVKAWETNIIESVEPNTHNRLRDTVIRHRLYTNETSQYDLQFYVKKPNGTILTLGSRTGRLGDNVSREFTFQIDHEKIDQFGSWEFIVNESIQDATTSRDYDILPDPEVRMTLPDYIYTDSDYNFIEVEIDVEDLDVEEGVDPLEEIVPGKIRIYRLNETGGNNLTYEANLTKCRQANILEDQINTSTFKNGEFYQIVANFNISSCPSCRNYERERAKIVASRDDFSLKTFEGSKKSGVLIALSIIALSFAYLAINIGKKHGPLQIGFIFIFSLLSIVISIIMTVISSENIKGIVGYVSSGLSWFFILIIAYFLIYFLGKAFDLFES